MIRITVVEFTGRHTDNQKIARRIARKVRGATRKGTCVLIDWEHVASVTPDFMAELLASGREDRLKFCGLPISVQNELRAGGR